MYIKWGKKKEMQMPVLPSAVTESGSMNNTSVYIHGLGEINLKGKRGLYSMEIESFFPKTRYSFCKCKPKKPKEYISILKKLYEKNQTVQVIITGTPINFFATMESFSFGEEDASGDVKYNISFKEYREVTATKRKNKGTQRPTTAKIDKKTVKWKKGDTWQKLTKKVLGSSASWKYQRQFNKSVRNKAAKKNPGKKEKDALIGYKVTIQAGAVNTPVLAPSLLGLDAANA